MTLRKSNKCLIFTAEHDIISLLSTLERNSHGRRKQVLRLRTSIGGQALIEGILMRGPEKQAIVVRDQNGELVEKVEELRLIKDRHPILGWR